MIASPIEQLIQLIARLPGLGPRSARRVALHLMRQRESLMRPLAQSLSVAAEAIRACATCGNMDVTSPCTICADIKRDDSVLCVVEDLADLWAIERSNLFHGRYHVLGGTLSALDGRGPVELNMPALEMRVRNGAVQEVILATNATVEGQTTAHYLTELLASTGVKVTRLAQGIPMGGELEYLDDGTLGAALKARVSG